MSKIIIVLYSLIFLASVIHSEEALSEYQVKPGDTLAKISKEYLSDPSKWRELLQYNNVPSPDKIAPGLVLKIPAYLAKANPNAGKPPAANSVARMEFKAGEVKFKSADGSFKPVEAKQEFLSGDVVKTSGSGTAQIKFFKEPQVIIKIKPNTEVKLAEDGGGKTVTMNSGDLFAQVANKKGSKEEKLKVVTPTSVAGIRGTQFDVGLDATGNDSYSCQEGQMQIGAQGVIKELPAGFGISVKKGEPPSEPVKLLEKVQILPMEKE